ncbi:hypothetical protein CH366_17555 [Leptospira harrisiae]|uniref:Uncharacterized protein n=1 Tax=Leptospira harrisiae TaxID=2023189 RepID=A0A2N0AGA5_9LEPT|nr:hypothetical protein CH364_16720 [Leptospira harrisiae]PKA06633.1 hypothetical protein CH366_17555 [Leptospira harrisiae]
MSKTKTPKVKFDFFSWEMFSTPAANSTPPDENGNSICESEFIKREEVEKTTGAFSKCNDSDVAISVFASTTTW